MKTPLVINWPGPITVTAGDVDTQGLQCIPAIPEEKMKTETPITNAQTPAVQYVRIKGDKIRPVIVYRPTLHKVGAKLRRLERTRKHWELARRNSDQDGQVFCNRALVKILRAKRMIVSYLLQIQLPQNS